MSSACGLSIYFLELQNDFCSFAPSWCRCCVVVVCLSTASAMAINFSSSFLLVHLNQKYLSLSRTQRAEPEWEHEANKSTKHAKLRNSSNDNSHKMIFSRQQAPHSRHTSSRRKDNCAIELLRATLLPGRIWWMMDVSQQSLDLMSRVWWLLQCCRILSLFTQPRPAAKLGYQIRLTHKKK